VHAEHGGTVYGVNDDGRFPLHEGGSASLLLLADEREFREPCGDFLYQKALYPEVCLGNNGAVLLAGDIDRVPLKFKGAVSCDFCYIQKKADVIF